jgi:hypothetical protein
MDINSLKKNLLPIIYGLAVALAMVFVQAVYVTNPDYFWIGSIISFSILIFTIYLTRLRSTKTLRQLELPDVDNYTRLEIFIYHLLLPSIGFWSFTSFIYTNIQLNLTFLYFITAFFTYASLFINIRAYYLDKFKLEEDTHYVYDLIKIFSYFNLVTATLNLSDRFGLNFYIISALIFTIASLLTLIIILRKTNVNLIHLLIILLAGLSLGYLSATLNIFLAVSNLVIGFLSSLIFYLVNAILHHELDGTLRISTLVEYTLVAIICFLLILLFV